MIRLVVVLGLIGLIGTGCATQRDSDQPWNATQSWEGMYNIPGLSNN